MSKVSVPDKKQIQYDRQLRLWGDHGQHALENGRVCLIGGNALGTEILKSLVLPGLGSFTLIDHHLVTIADCGSNFFVHPSMIGQPRARVTCDLLTQLNPDVHGRYIDKPSIDELLKQNTLDFSQFHVVITANLPRKTLLNLAQHLWSLKVPLINARTYGFIGTLRLQVPEHYVIEAHPDDTIPDLRLDRPLPALIKHCDSIAMDSLKDDEQVDLPSLVILFKSLQNWQKQHNRSDIPRTRLEKDQFRDIIDQYSHLSTSELRSYRKHLENFEEAKRTIPSRLVQTTIPSNVKELFEDRLNLELTDHTNIFWFIVHALKLFTENEGHGLLPVRGEVPDMVTSTNSYIKLVQIYQDQAKHDYEIVQNYLLDLLEKYNASFREQDNLTQLVQIYCKNAAFLRVLRTNPIKNDDNLLDDTQTDLSWYLGLRQCDAFYEEFGRYPGEFPQSITELDHNQQQWDTDLNDLKQIGKKLFSSNSINQEKQQSVAHEQILEELCRYGASEIHSIAAFMGGSCAQEVIKLITHQYVPIDNTLIYNGIEQSISVLKL